MTTLERGQKHGQQRKRAYTIGLCLENYLLSRSDTMLIVLRLIWVVLVGFAFFSCQKQDNQSPVVPKHIQTLFAHLQASSPEAQADALSGQPAVWVDSFYQSELERYYTLADRERIEALLTQHQRLRPGDAWGLAMADFYRGSLHQWAAHYDSAYIFYNRAAKGFEAVHDTGFLLKVLYVQSSNLSVQGRVDEDIALKYRALELARNDRMAQIGLRFGLANAYLKKEDFVKPLELIQVSDLEWLAQRHDTIGLSYGLLVLNDAYCGQKEFGKALPYARQALALRQQAHYIQVAMVTEALYYYGKCLSGLGRWQEALDTLRQAELLIPESKNKQVQPILYYLIGEALFHLQQYPEADNYLQKSLNLSLAHQQPNSALVAYELLSRSKETQGQILESLRFYKRYIEMKDTLFDLQKDRTTRDLSIKYQTREKEWQIAALQQRNYLANQRNLWVMGSLLSVLIVLWFWSRQQARRLKAEKALAEARSNLFKQKLDLQTIELNAQRARLQDYTAMLLERNQRLADANLLPVPEQEEITPYRADPAQDLYNQVILTEADWEKFKIYFNGVYPNFLYNLKKRFEQISDAELRLFMLAEMGLDTKEMATMLGISTESVRKARYRIRKKFNLTGNQLDWN
jgi:tetratricopeptide (TPR) repeat protein